MSSYTLKIIILLFLVTPLPAIAGSLNFQITSNGTTYSYKSSVPDSDVDRIITVAKALNFGGVNGTTQQTVNGLAKYVFNVIANQATNYERSKARVGADISVNQITIQ